MSLSEGSCVRGTRDCARVICACGRPSLSSPDSVHARPRMRLLASLRLMAKFRVVSTSRFSAVLENAPLAVDKEFSKQIDKVRVIPMHIAYQRLLNTFLRPVSVRNCKTKLSVTSILKFHLRVFIIGVLLNTCLCLVHYLR